jgi:hypothetical protein
LHGPLNGDFTDGSIAATVAATVVTATAPVTAVTNATVATAGSGLTRLGLVDRQPAASVFLVVQTVDGRLRRVLAVHLDKPEATAAARLTVLDDLGTPDLAKLGEQLFEVGTGGLERQVPNIQLLQGRSLLGTKQRDPC